MSISLFTKRLKLSHNLLRYQKRFGYIVLVPEIGEDLPETNPLLRADGLPEFNNVTIEKCLATIGKQASDVEKAVINFEERYAVQPDACGDIFSDALNPIEQIESQLETTWGLAKCLYLGNSTLMPTKSYLQINDRARKARYAKFNSLPLFQAIAGSSVASNSARTDDEQKRLVHKYLLEGKLNGVTLPDGKKAVLNEALDNLKQERANFKGKFDVSVRNFAHIINEYGVVRDFPADVLQTFASDPLNPMKGPWKVTLQPNAFNQFLEHCPDRKLRWNVWQANSRKCSGQSEKALSNSVHIEQIRHLRKTQAKLLGYDSFVDMSMETKMAGNVENVKTMLANLLHYARPAQEQEIQLLEQFANKSGHNGSLELHDIPFWKRKHLKCLHKYDEDVIREYFPLPKVLAGMFALTEKLFQIKICERQSVHTWHEDVKFFDVFDLSQQGGTKPVAGFYLDLYSREDDKIRGTSGLMVGVRNRCRISDNCPLAAMIFNLPVPMYGKPSLLSFNEVQTLFMKFGHSLQHLLTRASYSELAGLSNIEWDAVEVASHVMSHLLHHQDTIKSISGHFMHEDAMPDDLVAAIQGNRKHLAGYTLCRELYVARLDIELHSRKDFWFEVVKSLWSEYNVMPLDKKDAHPCSLTDIFSGDWAAAYYSHVWARVIAADVYSAFYEAGQNAAEFETVGQRFRDTYLALGGSCHASEVFRRFRGRDPSPKALLKTLGLAGSGATSIVKEDSSSATD